MKRMLAIAILLMLAASTTGRSTVGALVRVKRVNKAPSCPVTFKPETAYSVAQGEWRDILISASPFCNWEAVANDPWIAVMHEQGQGDGKITIMTWGSGRIEPRVGTVTINDQILNVVQAGNFTDVTPAVPYQLEIGRLNARGITSGCGRLLYCPGAYATREQVAIMLVKALGISYPPIPPRPRFADVPPTRAGYAFIEELARRGITSGCSPNNYCPDNLVTREQLAVLLVRARGVFNPTAPPFPRYLDVPPGTFSYPYIEALADKFTADKVLMDCGTNLFCPYSLVTRGDLAGFLVRALDLW